MAKSFVKWVGGKARLLPTLQKKYPRGIGLKYNKYCEPFVGGGAVLFDVLTHFRFDEILINDINCELINTYVQIKMHVDDVICELDKLQTKYLALESAERDKLYYSKRDLFNLLLTSHTDASARLRAVLFIFLNKTCYNGLYRVNKKGQFNASAGDYKSPLICDAENLMAVSNALQNVEIRCGDFRSVLDFADSRTFLYLDPPYRPLDSTAKFTSYSVNGFSDRDQQDLLKFCKEIHSRGAKFVLSNSDPKNYGRSDEFFDRLYEEFSIDRVYASRSINCKGDGREKVTELLVTNF